MKTNSFGLYLLELRNIQNENMNDMAERLGVSKSYLYYLSSGERTVSNNIINKLIKEYKLDKKEIEELNKSVAYSRNVIKIDLSGLEFETRKLIVELIHRIPDMSKDELEQLRKVIM